MAVLAVSAALVGGCASPQRVPDGHVRIVVLTSPPGTIVTIDGEVVPSVERAEGSLVSPGPHRLRVDARGYLPQRIDVDVVDGETYVVEVELWPSLPELDEPGGESLLPAP